MEIALRGVLKLRKYIPLVSKNVHVVDKLFLKTLSEEW